MLSDRLRSTECDYTQRAIDALQSVSWAAPLLNNLRRAGGLQPENKPLMFEVRFAFELYRAGVVAQYEYPTGVGSSSVDFRIPGPPEWFIEIVSIRASDAVKRATHQTGIVYTFQMSTNASDPRQSPEAEMMRVEGKIGEKVLDHDLPTKFPIPGDAIHLILIDMRGYLDQGGDINDYQQIAYGWHGFIPERPGILYYWGEQPEKREPIKGLFEENNPLRSAHLIQERIHFLGFINELEYQEGEMRKIGYYLANWHLFSGDPDARKVFASYPLQPEPS